MKLDVIDLGAEDICRVLIADNTLKTRTSMM